MTVAAEDYIESDEGFESKAKREQRLFERQNELADLIGVNPELLRGIGLCETCYGHGQLLDTSVGRVALNSVDISGPVDNTKIKKCEECGGIGLEFGDLGLTAGEWIGLSRNNLHGIKINRLNSIRNPLATSTTSTEDATVMSEEERTLLEEIRVIKTRPVAWKPHQRGRDHTPDIKIYRKPL
jgi:hypothetical protein